MKLSSGVKMMLSHGLAWFNIQGSQPYVVLLYSPPHQPHQNNASKDP